MGGQTWPSIGRLTPPHKNDLQRSPRPAHGLSTRSPCIGPGMGVVAHLQAIEGDEVDLDAEAWATTPIPGPLRGDLGRTRSTH